MASSTWVLLGGGAGRGKAFHWGEFPKVHQAIFMVMKKKILLITNILQIDPNT